MVRADIVSKCEDIPLEQSQVRLSDFGESFKPDTTKRLGLHTPLLFCPPEHLVSSNRPVSYSADIWSLACSMFVILGQRNVFDASIEIKHQVLKEQVDAMGSMPPEMFEMWEERQHFFDDEQQPINRISHGPTKAFSGRIDSAIVQARRRYEYGQLEEEERKALEALLRSMLAMKPEDRITAKDVLESEWMTEWALPDLNRARELWKQEEREAKQVLPVVDENKRQEEGDGGSDREQDTEEGSWALAKQDKAGALILEDESAGQPGANTGSQEQETAVSGGRTMRSGQAILNMVTKKRVDTMSAGRGDPGNAARREDESLWEEDAASVADTEENSKKARKNVGGQAKTVASLEEASPDGHMEKQEAEADRR